MLDLADLLKPSGGVRLDLATVVSVTAARASGLRRIEINMYGSHLEAIAVLSYTPAAGDVVLVARAGEVLYVLGSISHSATPVTPPPPPPAQSGVSNFPAIDAGSWQARGRRSDRAEPISGQYGDSFGGINTGAFFYGYAPHATLNGATVTAAYIWIDRRPGGNNAAQPIELFAHPYPDAPVQTPGAQFGTRDIGGIAVGSADWRQIPTEWAQAIIDGTSRGLGIGKGAKDPYVVLASLAQSGMSGTLSIHWRR